MSTEYSEDIIQEQAENLYRDAESAPLVSLIVYGVSGLLLGAAAFYFLGEQNNVVGIIAGLGLPIALAGAGAVLGERKATRMRSDAQYLLAILTIERNTRKDAIPRSA